jgi:cytoskeleton protein RodZ
MSVRVGQQLRQARQTKNLSLEQISRATYIRVRFLEALEAGQLDQLPSLAQARGFLRTYAKYLGLDPDTLIPTAQGEYHAPVLDTPDDVTPSPPATNSEGVFYEIGQILRQHRDTLGLKLEDIEGQTHVRKYYLQALETGDLEALPSPVQGRGMLNNYATFLGLDPEPLLLKFADGLQAGLSARRGTRPGQPDPRSVGSAPRRGGRSASLRRYLSSDLLFGGALGIALLFFIIWGAVRVSSLGAAELPVEDAPAIVDVLAPEDTPTPSPTPGDVITLESPAETAEETSATPEFPIPVLSEGSVQLYIVVKQRTWMRITVDGEIEFEGRVIPGSAYTFSGQESIGFLTGSGSALQVFYNSNDLGSLGLVGEVIQRTFTRDGILLPTPTITPTPTINNTPEATQTPQATETPQP